MAGEILSQRELRRYSKQIMIPEIGTAGQEKLKKSKVLVVGAGGIGCPVLQYLAAAGVGKVAIVENDMVNETNLQRQVLYGSDDVGKLKSIIAKKRLDHLNSFVETEIFNLRLDASNALRIIKDFDIVVDATDNLGSRYIINDACVILNKPMVHGAIFKFEGQVSVFNYNGGPTYRCYNPAVNEEEFINPDPAETGVTGVLPGITGIFMVNEIIKIITGSGKVLSGEVLLFNLANNSFRLIKVNNIPENHQITSIGANQSVG
jgi:sulfur-carrier protein adenylyltransferase/sulfurtransferase